MNNRHILLIGFLSLLFCIARSEPQRTYQSRIKHVAKACKYALLLPAIANSLYRNSQEMYQDWNDDQPIVFGTILQTGIVTAGTIIAYSVIRHLAYACNSKKQKNVKSGRQYIQATFQGLSAIIYTLISLGSITCRDNDSDHAFITLYLITSFVSLSFIMAKSTYNLIKK